MGHNSTNKPDADCKCYRCGKTVATGGWFGLSPNECMSCIERIFGLD